jgi:hypothetical protein
MVTSFIQTLVVSGFTTAIRQPHLLLQLVLAQRCCCCDKLARALPLENGLEDIFKSSARNMATQIYRSLCDALLQDVQSASHDEL